MSVVDRVLDEVSDGLAGCIKGFRAVADNLSVGLGNGDGMGKDLSASFEQLSVPEVRHRQRLRINHKTVITRIQHLIPILIHPRKRPQR